MRNTRVPTPQIFYGEQIPEEFNRALARQASLGEAGRRVYRAMCEVDATIRVDVEGQGGGTFFLNISAGRMSAGRTALHAPFLTLVQDRNAYERLACEAGDSALALIAGVSGLAGGMKLTPARIESFAEVDGLLRFEVTGEDGFVVGAHFGSAPMPPEPKATITMDREAYRDLRSGALDPQSAFMNQQIVVKGDMQAAMQLALAAISPD